jgi:DegV family protein with EDD domain
MKRYVIVTESGSDLSHSILSRHHIQVLPMHVALGNADYTDGSISIEELCDYYDKTGKTPTTSAVSPYEYQKVFEKIGTENPKADIIHISYSSRVSNTFQNALIASKGVNSIYHIDSLNVSGGLALVVMKAIQLIEKFPDITSEKLVACVKACADLTRFAFIPGNLDYLRAGGRVSNAQYLGASLLKIKPLIEIVDGKLISAKKHRGSMKNVAQQVIKDFFSKFEIDKKEICLVHTSRVDEETRSDMEKHVRALGVEKVTWLQAGCVITTHSGPGGIGIAAMEKG